MRKLRPRKPVVKDFPSSCYFENSWQQQTVRFLHDARKQVELKNRYPLTGKSVHLFAFLIMIVTLACILHGIPRKESIKNARQGGTCLNCMQFQYSRGCKFEANLCCRIDPVSNRTTPPKSIHNNIKVTHQAYFFKISLCVHVGDPSTCVNKQTQTSMMVLYLLFLWLVIFGHLKLYSEDLYFENGFARTTGTLIAHFLNAFVLFSLVQCSKCWISYSWLRALLRNFTLRTGDPVSKGLTTQMEDLSCDPQHRLVCTHL